MVAFRATWLDSARIAEFARRQGKFAGAWLLLIAVAAFTGFQQLFSSFATYDDEGYVLLSLRMFLSGRSLYDDVYTQYGPAYYALQSLLHCVTGLPVTHDVARWKTLAVWLASAGMCAGFVQRETGRPWLSAVAFLATFFHLDRLGLEPGHPQDICLPILVAMLFLSTFVQDSKLDLGVVITAGLLIGTITTTKLNLGVFCGIAWTLAQLAVTRKSGLRTLAIACLLLGVLALPFVLLKHHALTWGGAKLAGVVVVGAIGLWLAWRRLDRNNLQDSTAANPLRSVFFTLGFAAGAALLFVAVALRNGTSLEGLYWGLIGQHAGFAADCYAHPPLPTWTLAWTVFTLIAVLRQPKSCTLTWWLLSGAGVMLVLLQSRYWGESFNPVVHGLYDRGWASVLAVVVPPLASLLLVDTTTPTNGSQPAHSAPRFARWLLACFVVLQPLAMIPVPGTQVAIGTLPALLALFLVCSDLVDRLLREGQAFQKISPNAAFKALMLFAVITLGMRCWKNWQRRSTCEPLQLPGAEMLCLPHEEALKIQKTVAHLRDHADTFVTLPCGFNSLYLWTGKTPPTGFNTTVWDVLLDHRRQRQIMDALEAAEQPRLVVYTDWPPVNRVHAPLVRYLQEKFTSCEVEGRAQIWKRPEEGAEKSLLQKVSTNDLPITEKATEF